MGTEGVLARGAVLRRPGPASVCAGWAGWV